MTNDYGLPEKDVAALKTKADLLSTLEKVMFNERDALDEVKFEMKEQEREREPEHEELEEKNVNYAEPGWSEYVLSLLQEEERDPNGNPKVTGLRRLAETLLGDIVFTGPISLFPSNNELDAGRASVIYEVIFDWRICKKGEYINLDRGLTQRVFRAAASCFPGNMPDSKFNVHPEAIAETRAEARCLRKALALQCVAAEEVGSVDYAPTSYDKEKISTPLAVVIKSNANKLGVDVTKLVQKEFKKGSLDALSKSEAQMLIQKLDDFQRTRDIPVEVKQ